MKKRIILLFIIIVLLFLLGYEIFKGNIKINKLSNNSVAREIYYCDDSSYTLENNNCIKYVTNNKVLKGDANLDNIVDINDVNYINDYINKKIDLNSFQIAASDLNEDSQVDTLDISIIQNNLLKEDTKSYVCAKDYQLENDLCVKKISISANLKKHVKGDITLDGKVDNDDEFLILNYLINKTYISELAFKMADTNNDDILDKKDLNYIKKITKDSKVTTYKLDEYKKELVNDDINIYIKDNIKNIVTLNTNVKYDIVFETNGNYYYKFFNVSMDNVVESSLCKKVDAFKNRFKVTITGNNDHGVLNFYTDDNCNDLKAIYRTKKLEVKQ